MKRALTVVALVATLAPASEAQQLDRSKRPAAPPPPPFKLPPITTRVLPNGLTVRVMENHALQLVAVRGLIEGGSLLDPAGREGLFALDTLLARTGTASKTPDQVAQEIGELGAPVSPTGFTNVTGSFERALALMGDMLRHPSFPADAVQRRKTLLAAALQRSEDSTRGPGTRILNVALWGESHPLARVASPKSINAITRDEIAAFHEAHVRPQNVTITVVGDITVDKAVAAVTKVFGDWQKVGERTVVVVPPAPAAKPTTIYLFDRPNAPQSTMFIGQAIAPRSSKDFYAVETLGALFGGPTGSRLSVSLRERRPLTYGISHVPLWRRLNDPATLIGVTNVDIAKTDSALAVWLGEVKNLTGGRPFTDAELSFARSATVGSLLTRIETIDQVASQLNLVARDGLPATYYDDYAKGMNAVTVADVTAAAARAVDPSLLTIVVVGDRQKIESILRAANIAPVVVVDQDGRPVK